MKKRRSGLLLRLFLCAALIFLTACSGPKHEAKRGETVTGTVTEIEKYGHADLDISIEAFSAAGFEPGDIVTVKLEGFEEDMPYFTGYYSKPGTYMIRGSTKDTHLALCINYGIFAEDAGVEPGDKVTLALKEKAGALDEERVNSLEYVSYDRADYDSDAEFANFRCLSLGGIAEGRIYRSSSPIDNSYNRARYSAECVESVRVKAVLNLSDTGQEIEELFLEEDFSAPFYKELYENGSVIALGLGADFFSDEFAKTLAGGLGRLAEKEGPYLIHCKEGRDRAGFTAMLLSALMGAELEEIKNDYMISYYNNFGISREADPQKYEAVLELNLMAMIRHISGIGEGGSPETVDLSAAAEKYLLDAGMEKAQIDLLRSRLS